MPFVKTSWKLPGRKIHRPKPSPSPMCCGTCGKKMKIYETVDAKTGVGFCSVECWILREI